jgi:hypothetical protein
MEVIKGLACQLSGAEIISTLNLRVKEHTDDILSLSKDVDKLELELTGKLKFDEDIRLQIEQNVSDKKFHQERINFLKFWAEHLNKDGLFLLSNHDLIDYELMCKQNP